MNRSVGILLGVYLWTCLGAGTVWAEGKQKSDPGDNVRVVLTIQKENEEPVSFSIVTVAGSAKLDNLGGLVEIDGNQVPVVLRFEANLIPFGDGEYLVACTYGMSTPVVTTTSTTKGGVGRSSFQYQDIGAQATVRMTIGEELTFMKDPEKKVTLRLERVDEQRP